MIKLTALITLIVASVPAAAQFTMSDADFPSVGTSYQYIGLDTSGINEGMGGSGQTWDFSTASANGINLSLDVITPSSHPEGASFPNATHCYNYSDGIYQFYSISADSMVLEGDISLVNTPIAYQLKPTVYRFPLNLNDIQQDTMSSNYNGGPVGPALRYGDYNTLFDGDGILQLPNGLVYANTNRIVTFALITDSSLVFPAATSKTILTKIEWYEQGIKVPVMYTETREVSAGGSPNTTRSVYYMDTSIVSLDKPSVFNSVKLFPNPVNDKVQLSYELTGQTNALVEVYNMTGNLVRVIEGGNQTAGSYRITINTSDLSRGMYFVRLSSGEFTETRKLVLK